MPRTTLNPPPTPQCRGTAAQKHSEEISFDEYLKAGRYARCSETLDFDTFLQKVKLADKATAGK